MFLEVKALEAGYGDIQVLWGVDLAVERGECVAIIGSNGAGKTTFMYTLAGVIQARGGEVLLDGRRLSGLAADEVVRQGLTVVPQGRRLFPSLAVKDNLLMGAFARKDGAVMETLRWVYELFPRLKERENQLAGTLSGGEQQMCAVARALMAKPKVLCIDELSLGLAPVITDAILDVVDQIRREGITVVLVEQDVENALLHADRAYVMEHGRITLSGVAAEMREHPQVKAAYLGL